MKYALWIVQALLALEFVFAGSMKLVLPLADLTQQIPLPGLFIRLIGTCEVLAALGLILPGALRIKQHLTPLAARCLVVLMVGATLFTPPDQLPTALIPIVTGLLAAFVAYGRENPRHTAPARRHQLQHAS